MPRYPWSSFYILLVILTWRSVTFLFCIMRFLSLYLHLYLSFFVFVWILGSYLSSPGDLWLSCSPSSNSFPGITSPTHGSDTRGLKFKKIRFLNGSSIQLVCVSYGTDLVCLGNMGKWGSEKMILSPTWPLEQISNDSIRQLQVLPLQLLLVDVIHHRLNDQTISYRSKIIFFGQFCVLEVEWVLPCSNTPLPP